MNLTKLFEMQKVLDQDIERNHPIVEGEDRLSKKIIALQQELAEVVQELPEVFKFWSNKKNNYEKALKEYVDTIHFLLSLGNDIGYNFDRELKYNTHFDEGIGICVCEINITISEFYVGRRDGQNNRYYHFENMLVGFMVLKHLLGFTDEQVEQAYLEKNKINFKRQAEGY